jgi:hypothetical protein
MYIYFPAGEDYELVHQNLTFTNGSESGARVCFDIPILNDAIVEGDQHFLAHLESEGGVVIHSPDIVVNIHDDDSKLVKKAFI